MFGPVSLKLFELGTPLAVDGRLDDSSNLSSRMSSCPESSGDALDSTSYKEQGADTEV